MRRSLDPNRGLDKTRIHMGTEVSISNRERLRFTVRLVYEDAHEFTHMIGPVTGLDMYKVLCNIFIGTHGSMDTSTSPNSVAIGKLEI
jgi:hypothetical protein